MRRHYWMYLGMYVVLFAATLPLVLGLVPPNRWYGFRFPGAMTSSTLWYEINQTGGKLFMGALGVCLLINLLLIWLGTQQMLRYLGWINAVLVLLSFWLVTVELVPYLP